MIIRNIKSSDTEEIISLWKQTLPYLCINKRIFYKKVWLEANFSPDGFFVAEEKNKIVGFVNAVFRRVPICAEAKIEESSGWIAGFILDKNHLPVGDLLLKKAEDYLKENEKTTISTGYYPTYFTQGVDEEITPEYKAIFEKRDYRKSVSKAKALDLSTYTEPESIGSKRKKLAEEGVYIGPLTEEYLDKLLTLDNDFLSPSWLYEYKNRLSDMDFERFRIAVIDGKVVGASVFSDPDSNPERFGPFGVSDACQGKGIGSVLLADTLALMKKRGLASAWMQWCSHDPAANIVYERAGFTDIHTYCEYQKELR